MRIKRVDELTVVTRLSGTHHGCYLPHESANDIAYALFSFPNLAAYEEYRNTIRKDPEARQLFDLADRTQFIRRFERSFLRPALQEPTR